MSSQRHKDPDLSHFKKTLCLCGTGHFPSLIMKALILLKIIYSSTLKKTFKILLYSTLKSTVLSMIAGMQGLVLGEQFISVQLLSRVQLFATP